MKRWFWILGGITGLLILAGFTCPGPIHGVWQVPLTRCACSARSYTEFDGDKAIVWSEHVEDSGPIGSLQKVRGGWRWMSQWDPNRSIGIVRPKWFIAIIEDEESGERFTCWRILSPWTRNYARTLVPPTAANSRTSESSPASSSPAR
jgi:hypothetical protein